MMETDPVCEICGERCDSLAGNPSKWPLHLGNGTDAHVGCVNKWLYALRDVGRALSLQGFIVNVTEFSGAIDALVRDEREKIALRHDAWAQKQKELAAEWQSEGKSWQAAFNLTEASVHERSAADIRAT